MEFAKSGEIHNFCLTNAILTFKEYILDYSDEKIKYIGNETIEKSIKYIPNPKVREKVKERRRHGHHLLLGLLSFIGF